MPGGLFHIFIGAQSSRFNETTVAGIRGWKASGKAVAARRSVRMDTTRDDIADGFPGLSWPDLVTGRLVKRYKRFLADVELEDGRTVTAHCPNSGSMKACSEPGRKVYLSCHDNPKRKLKYTWELIEMPDSLVGVNTVVPNRLLGEAMKAGVVEALSSYDRVRPEVKTSKGTRLDFLISDRENRRCYVEIKNCSLVAERVAFFPDAVTKRGLKHLIELQRLAGPDIRCIIFYLVQRMDADVFRPAVHIDETYAEELRRATENGVDILVYDTKITREHISLGKRLPYEL